MIFICFQEISICFSFEKWSWVLTKLEPFQGMQIRYKCCICDSSTCLRSHTVAWGVTIESLLYAEFSSHNLSISMCSPLRNDCKHSFLYSHIHTHSLPHTFNHSFNNALMKDFQLNTQDSLHFKLFNMKLILWRLSRLQLYLLYYFLKPYFIHIQNWAGRLWN